MANNFSASFIEVWSKTQQEVFYKQNVARMIADLNFQSDLKKGDVLHRPYRSSNTPQIYTRGTDINLDDKTDTDETLTVQEEWATGFYVDDFDQIQDNYDIAAGYGKDDGEFLSNTIDTMVLGEALNAFSTVDGADVGGSAGDPIAVDTSNIMTVFAAARTKIQKQNVPFMDAKAVISPDIEQRVGEYMAGRDTGLGDAAVRGGAGFLQRFLGFDVFVSNQLPCTAVLSLATQPTNTDTVVIAGITFTFVSSIGSTAGNVLIGADADAARLNLTTLINTPGTTTSTGVAFTGENLRKLRLYASAVNDATANTLTLTYKGNGVIAVSETLTATTDSWGTVVQYPLMVAGRAPVCVIQREPRISVKDHPFRHGKNILNGTLFGKKTFRDNAFRMVKVAVDTTGFSV